MPMIVREGPPAEPRAANVRSNQPDPGSTVPAFDSVAIVVLAVLLVGIVVIAAMVYPTTATEAYAAGAYYAIFAIFLLWAGTFGRYVLSHLPGTTALLRRRWAVIAAAGCVAVSGVTGVPARFRVLSDETNVLSVSQDMGYRQSVYNRTLQRRYGGVMHPVVSKLDPRPLGFPFFVSLLHSIRGYRVENIFLANAAAFFALLAVIGIAIAEWKGTAAGVVAVFLASAPPIVVLSARSAGFDLFATLWSVVALVSFCAFMRRPNADTFALFSVNLLMLVNTRYESVVIGGVLVVAAFASRKAHLRFIWERPWLYVGVTLLMLPVIVQRFVTSVSANTPRGMHSFGLDHLLHWSWVLIRSQADLGGSLPYALALNWAAVGILGFVAVRLWQRRPSFRSDARWVTAAAVLVAVLAHLVVILCFYSSDYTHPVATRYFLNISIFTALVPLLLFPAAARPVVAGTLVLLSVGLLFVYRPVAQADMLANRLEIVRRFDYERSFLNTLPSKDVLVIANRPGQISALDFGAVDFKYAKAHRLDLRSDLGQHLYAAVYVFQRVDVHDGEPNPEDRLDGGFDIEPIEERQTTSKERIRVSRVVGVAAAPIGKPATSVGASDDNTDISMDPDAG